MNKNIINHDKSEERLRIRADEFWNYTINNKYEMEWEYLCNSNKGSDEYPTKKEYLSIQKRVNLQFKLISYSIENSKVKGDYGRICQKTIWKKPWGKEKVTDCSYWIYENGDWYYDVLGYHMMELPIFDKQDVVKNNKEPEVEKSWDEATEKKLVARAEEFSNHLIDQDTEKAWKYLSDKCKEETYVWSTQKKFKEDVKKNFNEATCTEYSVITVESILDNEAKLMTKFTCSVKDNKAQDYYWRETWIYENGDWFYVSKAFWN